MCEKEFTNIMEFICVLIGLISGLIGFIIGYFIQNGKNKSDVDSLHKTITDKDIEIADLNKKTAIAEAQVQVLNEKINSEQKSWNEIQENMILQFKNLSNSLLEYNSQKLSEKNLELLKPFKEKITEFEKSLKEDSEKRVALDTILKEYQSQCVQISKEAHNLANALKAETKKKGCWGEFILERILESSGLIKEVNYTLQEAFKTESGRNQPDAVIYLPENRHVVIDSKVPLNAYEKLFNAEDEAEREKYKKEFVCSIQAMIKNLGEKKYEQNKGINTPDFVLLFIPLEGAFSTLYKESADLIESAWNQKVIIVSPSSLLIALKTIEVFWREEKQAKHVRDIALESGKLYDKFVSLLEDLTKMSRHITNMQETQESLEKKLSTGRGNIIGQVQKIKDMGAITKKSIPQSYLESLPEGIDNIQEEQQASV